MDKRGWMILKVIINRYHPKDAESLMKFLPKEDVEQIRAQNVRSVHLNAILSQPKDFLHLMHYSWITSFIERFPLQIRPLIEKALEEEQVCGVPSRTVVQPLSPPIKNFLVDQISEVLKTDDHLPIQYLPESELSILLTSSKNQIIEMIDYICLHDLAVEIRKLVNKTHLQNIYSCLTQKQIYFLKICLHQKETVVAPKLDIDPTKFDCKQLKKALHQRGLIRFAKALCGEHSDFLWYLSHKLDTGRGRMIQGVYNPSQSKNVTDQLKSQLLNVINFLKSE